MQKTSDQDRGRLNGKVILDELIRNMELGQFEMAYTVLLPCVFTVYLNPEDYSMLRGISNLVIEDAKRALRAKVAELNSNQNVLGFKRSKPGKEYAIANRDWTIELLPDPEVPPGDVEIHSELNEAEDPGFRGMKTTLMDREPSVTPRRTTTILRAEIRPQAEPVYAEIQYEDDSGAQMYSVTQNLIRLGRGGDEQPMDLALYTSDEVSREHLLIRRDAATGFFFVTDLSTNGTWVNGKRLRKGVEEMLPARAQIGVAEVITLTFEARK